MRGVRVEVRDLVKDIRGRRVLNHVDMVLNPGHAIGVAGPNGSGKTMLMRCIAGLIKPTSGSIFIDGELRDVMKSPPVGMGMLLESPAFIDRFSGLDNLVMIGGVSGRTDKQQAAHWMRRVGLDPADKRGYRSYSLGMRQRLGLACALMGEPQLILLDEPTNALDESGVTLVRELVVEARQAGSTLLISSHDATLLNDLCDEIWKLAEGHIDGHIQMATDDAILPVSGGEDK